MATATVTAIRPMGTAMATRRTPTRMRIRIRITRIPTAIRMVAGITAATTVAIAVMGTDGAAAMAGAGRLGAAPTYAIADRGNATVEAVQSFRERPASLVKSDNRSLSS